MNANVNNPKPLETAWQRKFLSLNAHHPGVQKAATEAERFCNRWVTGDTNLSTLVLVGQPGCGKTHILKRVEHFCRAAKDLAFKKRSEAAGSLQRNIPSVLFMFWPTIADDLRKDQDWAVKDATEADVLLWDDLGAEDDPWKKIAGKACQILSRRESKFTVITTNVQPDAWATKFDQRVADRFMRNSVVVDMSDVPSYTTVL